MTEVNRNPFIPFPPRPMFQEAFQVASVPQGGAATVPVPPVGGILMRDLLPIAEQALVEYAYFRRVAASSRLVVYFSQQAYDLMATSGLDLRQWFRVRGAVIRTLPSANVFLSFLAEQEIKDHLFLVMEEGDL